MNTPMVILIPARSQLARMDVGLAEKHIPGRRQRKARLEINNRGLVSFGTDFDISLCWACLEIQCR